MNREFDLFEADTKTNQRKPSKEVSAVASLGRTVSARSFVSGSTQKTGKNKDAAEEDLPDVSFWRLLKMNKPEWCWMLSEMASTEFKDLS